MCEIRFDGVSFEKIAQAIVNKEIRQIWDENTKFFDEQQMDDECCYTKYSAI